MTFPHSELLIGLLRSVDSFQFTDLQMEVLCKDKFYFGNNFVKDNFAFGAMISFLLICIQVIVFLIDPIIFKELHDILFLQLM